MNYSIYCAFQGLLLLFLLTGMGCTQEHSVQVSNDSLSFFYRNAEAKEIFFASSMDHFQRHPVIKGGGNIWLVTVPMNKEFVYFYIVDGEITVPDCPDTVLDDFGARNCLYVSDM